MLINAYNTESKKTELLYHLQITYYKYFPHTIQREKIAKEIEIFASPCGGPCYSFLHIVHIMCL